MHALHLGLDERFADDLVAVVAETYGDGYPGLVAQREELSTVLRDEESRFRRTVHRGLRELEKLGGATVTGDDLFVLADTWGFPVELSVDEVRRRDMALAPDWREGYALQRERQRARSRAAATSGE
ncbi:alanine--tRNA ligase-related protein [Cellulosimicrobium sp. CpK407]|uniref:alanine--tRNA ligase-related protein n=1 Tax=Cellulosimicrobium sp. CpK407 TaxID=3229847 RepID=UPI003F3CC399